MSVLSEREKRRLHDSLRVGLLAGQRLGEGHEADERNSIRTTEDA
jgi:hypothetical protein